MFRNLALLFAFLVALQLNGQEVLFQSDFSEEAGFDVVLDSDSDALFGYEYNSFDDIPEAPHSSMLGGTPFEGLKMVANEFSGVGSEVAAVTTGLDLTGPYQVQVDVWLNYNFPAGTAGTTEFGGFSVGHDGLEPGPNGASFYYTTDGDAGTDYRLYKNGFVDIGVNNTDEPFVTAFPGVDIGEAVPGQGIEGTTPDGTGGFRWMTLRAEVMPDTVGSAGSNPDPGVATFFIADNVTGNEIEVGTIDNSTGDVVNMTGEVALIFADLFASISSREDLSFGLFDNLIVSTLSDVSECGPVSDLLGDLNGDNAVAFQDFVTLSSNFGQDVSGRDGNHYELGDIDCNGNVGFQDFVTLSSNFGQSAGATAAAVPEPASLSILAIGLIGTGLCRRRRS